VVREQVHRIAYGARPNMSSALQVGIDIQGVARKYVVVFFFMEVGIVWT
jgi:hypothetical protein